MAEKEFNIEKLSHPNASKCIQSKRAIWTSKCLFFSFLRSQLLNREWPGVIQNPPAFSLSDNAFQVVLLTSKSHFSCVVARKARKSQESLLIHRTSEGS